MPKPWGAAGSRPQYSSMWKARIRLKSIVSSAARAASTSFWEGAAAKIMEHSSRRASTSRMAAAMSAAAARPMAARSRYIFTRKASAAKLFISFSYPS